MACVPVIDISPLCKDSNAIDGQAAEKAIQQIHQACRDVGFFYITGHGVDQSFLELIFSNAKRFFALPLEKKNALSIHNNKSYNGYIKTGSENTLSMADMREGIYFGHTFTSSVNPHLDQDVQFSRSQFPDESDLPGFTESVKTYVNKISDLGFIMLRALASGLGLRENYLDEMFAQPSTSLISLGLLHYPPFPGDTSSFGVGPHTDYGMCTFVLQDGIGGLEADIDGKWVELKPIPGTFVVNLGDCLEAWTKGLYRATRHRVRKSIEKDRYSAVVFFNPSAGCLIEPLDTEVTKDLSYKTNVKGMEMPFYFGDYYKFLLQKSHDC